ncbi:MAG: ATP-binding protein [Chitinophagales bacterium]
MSATTLHKELCLKSHPTNIVLIEPFVEDLCRRLEVAGELYGNILVCITEAVNNAILHGNKSNSDKEVHVEVSSDKHILTCTVSDEGMGFDYNHLPDPTAPENIEQIGGRGIFLMKHLSDVVIFSNDGSNVEIRFRL